MLLLRAAESAFVACYHRYRNGRLEKVVPAEPARDREQICRDKLDKLLDSIKKTDAIKQDSSFHRPAQLFHQPVVGGAVAVKQVFKASPAVAHFSDGPTRFHRLPPEIRAQIYKEVVKTDAGFNVVVKSIDPVTGKAYLDSEQQSTLGCLILEFPELANEVAPLLAENYVFYVCLRDVVKVTYGVAPMTADALAVRRWLVDGSQYLGAYYRLRTFIKTIKKGRNTHTFSLRFTDRGMPEYSQRVQRTYEACLDIHPACHFELVHYRMGHFTTGRYEKIRRIRQNIEEAWKTGKTLVLEKAHDEWYESDARETSEDDD